MLFVAKGVVPVVLQQVAQRVRPLHHVPVGVEQIELRRTVLLAGDQVCAAQIPRYDISSRADFRHDALPVPQVGDARRGRAAPADMAGPCGPAISLRVIPRPHSPRSL